MGKTKLCCICSTASHHSSSMLVLLRAGMPTVISTRSSRTCLVSSVTFPCSMTTAYCGFVDTFNVGLLAAGQCGDHLHALARDCWRSLPWQCRPVFGVGLLTADWGGIIAWGCWRRLRMWDCSSQCNVGLIHLTKQIFPRNFGGVLQSQKLYVVSRLQTSSQMMPTLQHGLLIITLHTVRVSRDSNQQPHNILLLLSNSPCSNSNQPKVPTLNQVS